MYLIQNSESGSFIRRFKHPLISSGAKVKIDKILLVFGLQHQSIWPAIYGDTTHNEPVPVWPSLCLTERQRRWVLIGGSSIDMYSYTENTIGPHTRVPLLRSPLLLKGRFICFIIVRSYQYNCYYVENTNSGHFMRSN